MTATDLPGSDRDRFSRVRELFEAALARPSGERGAFLAEACAGEASLRAEVDAMLAADSDDSSVLDRPLPESAAALLEAREGVAPGTPLGAFRVVKKLGAGGMGTVYLAERADGAFVQQVAIKVFAASPALESRFRREQAILARLEHPRIARLVDAGIRAGQQPYFVLEYVDGRPLDEYLRAEAPSFRARVELFLEICDAVAFAHRTLVVHRDLKPQNVLVTGDGHVKLLDFGIAKLLAEDDVLATRTLHGVATPAYAAPEQLTGGPITTATDVWALGALFYQVLSGALPFPTRNGRVALEHAILHDDPPRPRSVSPDIPEDLEAIALAALRKEPGERTASVDALADDLRRWLERRPVRARGTSRRYRAARFVQRNRLALALGALAAAAVLGGLGAALWQARAARAEAGRAKLTKDFLVRLFFDANPAARGDATARGMLERAGDSLRRGELAATPEVRAELLELIAWLHGQRGEKDAEIEAMRAAIAAWSAVRPPGHPDLLASRGMLVYALGAVARWNEAESECRELAPFARAAGTAARPRAIILRSCARVATAAGRFDDAARDLRAAVAPARESEDRSFAALVDAELASALVLGGDYGGAHRAAADALEDLAASGDLTNVALGRRPPSASARASSGPDLVRAAGVTAMVATVETARRDFPAAEAALEATLPRVSTALGADHPLAVALRRRRALVWARTGRVPAALAELEALASSRGAAGGGRREGLLVRTALAEALFASGDAAGAARIAAEVMPELDRTVPESHLDRAEVRALLARTAAARGDRDEARRLLGEAARHLPAGHPFRVELAAAAAAL